MEKYTYKIISNDLENAGCIASGIKKMLIKKNIDRKIVRRVAIASYEAEINVAIHSYGGICNVILDGSELTLEYIDDGPGIPCIADAMKEGWSTASKVDNENGFGAGMGFPNMKKASDKLDVKSSPDGTCVVIYIKIR